jgi:hypothetical protein
MAKIRKKIVPTLAEDSRSAEPGVSVADTAEVLVSSESPDHPIHYLFDGRSGPRGTYWLASTPGDQTIVLAFDVPQNIRRVTVEVEEASISRTQEMTLSYSQDGGRKYSEVLRQEYTFSPPTTTFEQEDWTINVLNVTHLRVWIRPDKADRPVFATMTTLRLE